jgi:GMP synthase (glutamine-hydrolysing)
LKTALAIRHVAFEDLGSFESVLAGHGYSIAYMEAGLDDLQKIDPRKPDLLIVLGGPMGAYEEAEYPFILDELRILGKRLAADLPTLGVCLGSQLMARALGAKVYPGKQKEIGWAPLHLTDAGQRSCLGLLESEKIAVLHWHGDTFDLPSGAARLASTSVYENQAFSRGRCALALQFHLEATTKGLERWFIGHASEIAATQGVTVTQLRQDSARYGPALERVGLQCFDLWLREVAS